jgi:DNA (cytosine-5)-methyltransferase 1
LKREPGNQHYNEWIMELLHLSLFSGIGGFDLASNWAGFKTIAFCEKDKYCQQVLSKHWPDVPVFKDIKDVTANSLSSKGINLSNITLITGGLPCQPFSLAGKRRGKTDNRYLWPEMQRVISEVRPAWVCIENVVGFVSLALDEVCAEMEGQGYETQALIIPACAVGAPHRRDRIFIIANSNSTRTRMEASGSSRQEWECTKVLESTMVRQEDRPSVAKGAYSSVRDVPNANSSRASRGEWRLPAGQTKETILSEVLLTSERGSWDNLPTSRVCRSSDGIANRVERLRALGNMVVPQQCYPILKAIAEYEEDKRKEGKNDSGRKV